MINLGGKMAKVINLDHFGRGIVKHNNKITFIANALINEDIEYEIIKENKKYNLGRVVKINQESPKRVIPLCPYFNICGGCSLQHLNYQDTITFKKEKVKEIISKYTNLITNIKIIENKSPFNYRNKISLKIVNKEVGYYQNDSHNLVKINKCLIAKNAINKCLEDIKYLNIINGSVTIKCNYNNELLLVINTKDNLKIDIDYLTRKHKIVGIIVNDKIYYGEDKFIEIINNKLFQVSYNSFFQINDYITSKLFEIIKDNIKENSIVADMFCGVGTLGIIASYKAKKVYGIEVISNAIKNALINKKINKRDNIDFMLGDANKLVFKIKDKIDTIIVDPPRSGLSKDGVDSILKINPKDLIYISCDPMTLARDLNILKEKYDIKEFYIADMFSYTYHVESICLLIRKNKKLKYYQK